MRRSHTIPSSSCARPPLQLNVRPPCLQELARPPGAFVSTAYELSSAADSKDVRGLWALEKTLRSRLRDEFASDAFGPPVQTMLAVSEPGADASFERDACDPQSRHLLGRSACRAGCSGAALQRWHSPPPPTCAVGDGAVATLRWRPCALDGLGAPPVALIDRLFVLTAYRRRHIARSCLLNCLVDILQMAAAGNLAFSRCSIVVPEEPRLVPVVQLVQGLGFVQHGARREQDPTGMWGAAPGRAFVELALPVGNVMAVLQAARAANEGVRPAPHQ